MAKSRSFSIFLLKSGFDSSNSLADDDNELDDEIEAAALPAGAVLYVRDSDPHPPWWKDYFKISVALNQVSKGALVFVPVGGRVFVLAFGNVSHYLDSEAYEHDFGIRVTLNCVDPTQLRSTDSLDPGVGRRQRVQMPIGSDLTLLDFDQDSSILGRLTGKVLKKHEGLFKNATGAESLRVSVKLVPEELTELCASLLKLYRSGAYKKTFPNIQNVSPVRDPTLISGLNQILLKAVRDHAENVSLTVPEILNYEEGIFCVFRGAGRSALYGDVLIDHYYDYLADNNVGLAKISVDTLKNHKLVLADADGTQRGAAHSILKSLIYDCSFKGETYHLASSGWYRVEPGYVAALAAYLDPFCKEINLPPYHHGSEGSYNEDCPRIDASLVCLDRGNISPSGQTQIEPCDLYRVEGGAAAFYHVKVSTLSASLSHHFNQAANSLELLLLEKGAVVKLKDLIKTKVGVEGYSALVAPLDDEKHRVVFAIVTHKPKEAKSANLPLFARISLRRVIRSLKLMSTEADFGFVPDTRPPKPKTKKKATAALPA